MPNTVWESLEISFLKLSGNPVIDNALFIRAIARKQQKNVGN